MKEMLLVGRGGQGVVLASQLLADTLARAGFWVQSFPEFKAERRGAPIAAFLRWDEAPIHRRYKIGDCDVLVSISSAPPAPQTLDRVRPDGIVLLNRERRYPYAGAYELARVPGSAIARRNGVLSAEGRPMGNVAVLGACVRLVLPDGLDLLERAVRSRLGPLGAANVAAAREGYARCVRQHRSRRDAPARHAPPAVARLERPLFPISTTTSLGNHTGSWSLDRPVLTAACSACGLCIPFCPEGAMARRDHAIGVDYEYCKGCGICAVVCPVRGAVRMEEVRE